MAYGLDSALLNNTTTVRYITKLAKIIRPSLDSYGTQTAVLSVTTTTALLLSIWYRNRMANSDKNFEDDSTQSPISILQTYSHGAHPLIADKRGQTTVVLTTSQTQRRQILIFSEITLKSSHSRPAASPTLVCGSFTSHTRA